MGYWHIGCALAIITWMFCEDEQPLYWLVFWPIMLVLGVAMMLRNSAGCFTRAVCESEPPSNEREDSVSYLDDWRDK